METLKAFLWLFLFAAILCVVGYATYYLVFAIPVKVYLAIRCP